MLVTKVSVHNNVLKIGLDRSVGPLRSKINGLIGQVRLLDRPCKGTSQNRCKPIKTDANRSKPAKIGEPMIFTKPPGSTLLFIFKKKHHFSK